MRRSLLLPLFVLACTGKDAPSPAVEETTAVAQPATIPDLAPLQVAGTWVGRTTTETGDSVVAEWTGAVNPSDGSGTLTAQGDTVGVPFTTVFAGDSMVATSAVHADPATGARVVWTSVGRLAPTGTLGGTLVVTDSAGTVLRRGRWSAVRPEM